jgi:hypothetical protein
MHKILGPKKSSEDVAQVVEYLPSKVKTPSSKHQYINF